MLYGCTHCSEMMNKVQIVYSARDTNNSDIHPYFQKEAEAMKRVGFLVGVEPLLEANTLIYKGFAIYSQDNYPQDSRYIQGWKEYHSTMRLSIYYPLIEDISIPTFFVSELNEELLVKMNELGWSKVFIKNDVKSLRNIGTTASVYPDTSLIDIKKGLDYYPVQGCYAIRKCLNPEVFQDEDRYWVLNGKIYFRNNNIPKVVYEAAQKLNQLGSKYYVIDATPNFIVEVNPGECADRYGVNSPELFAKWFKDAFL